ncbi:YhbY family RNA-binding protein [Marinibactrum halimedae]|uniref:RNA-binding protein n=1 Tax=Marinibactrum halimedae TaxID=1444977 RepID=A0AA37TAJ6_9GAMM|nr:YhbY family RNA-binding protein [Marinibactrum halimedae]MCD9459009.1 YhbY family RNA-binding protein [Marinibactrum halimedae]GLS26861.1 putative RNA-binding protein [Marinibactrum halimedae]
MALSADLRKKYRNIGHNLSPIVTISGNGLSEGVLAELDRALNDHELIKVKVAVNDRDLRKTVITEMASQTHSEVVQEIGKVALLLRKAEKPNPKLSNLSRF